MRTCHHPSAPPADPGAHHRLRLIEEIAYLEGRLREMGQTGDCAYEHALARRYGELIREHRRTLAASSRAT